MNLTDPNHPWTRLTRAARSTTDGRDPAAPYGFTTRIVARAFEGRFGTTSLFERYALRAVGIAGLLAVLSIVANYSVLTSTAAAPVVAEDEELGDSPVALLLSVD
jgi:hypothetical protein